MMRREKWAKLAWALTAVWVLVLLFSLRTGWLNAFFFDTSHARVQGIDFFGVPSAGHNLLDGNSAFDTFRSGYAPYATWFLYHPAVAVVLGIPLETMSPWTAYRVWTAISAGLMALAAWLLLRRARDPVRRALVALVVMGAFPTFIMLFVGNMQSILVLALALVFLAVDEMREAGRTRRGERWLLAGLLLSLFTKPIVLAMSPLLLLLQPTRRSTVRALVIYVAVSAACLVVPGINPEGMSWQARWSLLTHPEVVRQTMNIYRNGFDVTAAMKDNAAHWFSMIALVDFRLNHIDVYSLPVFLDGWLGKHTPESLYRVPILLVLEVSVLVALVRNGRDRMQAALLTLMAASLLVFLSYGLAWEYSYTGVLPIMGMLLLRDRPGAWEWTVIALGAFVWAPSLYFLMSDARLALESTATLVRLDRIVPVTAMFVVLLARSTTIALRSMGGLRGIAGSDGTKLYADALPGS